MAWVRLDDRFLTNPKVIRAGRDARDVYLSALFYCAGELTDGRVPREVLPHLGHVAGVSPRRVGALAEQLVAVGLWEESEDGYQIHDYLEYQPSAAKVRAERAKTAQRVADFKARRAAYKKEGGNAPANGKVTTLPERSKPARGNAPGNAVVTGAPYPSRSPRESLPLTGESAPAAPTTPATPVPKPGKARQPLPKAVQLANSLLHLNLDESERELVTSIVSESEDDLNKWAAVCREWRARRHRPQVRGPLDWFTDGIPAAKPQRPGVNGQAVPEAKRRPLPDNLPDFGPEGIRPVPKDWQNGRGGDPRRLKDLLTTRSVLGNG